MRAPCDHEHTGKRVDEACVVPSAEMPSAACKVSSSGSAVASWSNGTWLNPSIGNISSNELQKFWESLSLEQRRQLLRIDKAALLEAVRRNMYCSRCHGLLVEGFNQILQQSRLPHEGEEDDPSLHPWGGLAATANSMLTVLDTFMGNKDVPLKVFESALSREKERAELYPDACGGCGGQGLRATGGSLTSSTASQGRGGGPKDCCALHTAKVSSQALVDFWNALGEETRAGLLRMREEDFVELLLFRFESKRFCRECRRNVLKEFKDLKELRRAKKEPRCNPWFCSADLAALKSYELTDRAVHADWQGAFGPESSNDIVRYEWGVGTSEGTCDIIDWTDVGLADSALAKGVDLSAWASGTPFWISIRGYRQDGKCKEVHAKASPVGRDGCCIHRRLWVENGVVAMNYGLGIQRFFDKADEIDREEEEEVAAGEMGGDLSEIEGGRPQKHAKSPELARDFLLDAATVIFKEQVEKAFREGTARQNAHSIFVCLGLSLLEEKVRVACGDITALERQAQLLLEEEERKRTEEEKRERRRLKEKEKKQKRKGKKRDPEITALTSADVSKSEIEEESADVSKSEIEEENADVSQASADVIMGGFPPVADVADTVSDSSSEGSQDSSSEGKMTSARVAPASEPKRCPSQKPSRRPVIQTALVKAQVTVQRQSANRPRGGQGVKAPTPQIKYVPRQSWAPKPSKASPPAKTTPPGIPRVASTGQIARVAPGESLPAKGEAASWPRVVGPRVIGPSVPGGKAWKEALKVVQPPVEVQQVVPPLSHMRMETPPTCPLEAPEVSRPNTAPGRTGGRWPMPTPIGSVPSISVQEAPCVSQWTMMGGLAGLPFRSGSGVPEKEGSLLPPKGGDFSGGESFSLFQFGTGPGPLADGKGMGAGLLDKEYHLFASSRGSYELF